MDIKKAIKRIIKRELTELTGQLHLPQWGKVVKVHAINSPVKSTPPEPAYCVDVQVIDGDLSEDKSVPVFKQVPLPATGSGEQRGFFCYPKVGALVEIGFMLGRPDRPFIRAVLVNSSTMPSLDTEDALISKDDENFYRIDSDDNISEQCKAIAQRVATAQQRLLVEDGGNMWVGNETENVLRLLSSLMDEVIFLANAVADHGHAYSWTNPGGNSVTEVPDNAAVASAVSTETASLKSRLGSFTE